MIHPDTFNFLEGLHENNHKPWFDEHQDWYKAIRGKWVDTAETILKKLAETDDSLSALEVKKCLFRINRDIRFSKDKSPYKTNFSMIFTPYGKKMMLAGYYVHLEKNNCFLAGGIYQPDMQIVKKIRREIHDFPEEWLSIVHDPEIKKFYTDLDIASGLKTKKIPPGFSPDHMAAEYLKLKSFTATVPIDDKDFFRNDIVDFTVSRLRSLKPMISYLNRGILDEEGGIL
jgi:uncharacterized protein (TIGR02453 family)